MYLTKDGENVARVGKIELRHPFESCRYSVEVCVNGEYGALVESVCHINSSASILSQVVAHAKTLPELAGAVDV